MKINRILALIALTAGLFAAFTSYSEKNQLYPTWKFNNERVDGKKVNYISATYLSQLLYAKEKGVVVLDLRSEQEYNNYHIPSARLYQKGESINSEKRSIFLVYGLDSDAEVKELEKELPGKVYLLQGGIESWYHLVLFPDFNEFKVRNSDALEQIVRRCRYFGGTPRNTQLLQIDVRQTRYREGC